MAVFPDIMQPSYPMRNRIEDPAILSKMENGIVVSRTKYTRSRETFILRWTALPAAHYNTLRSFFKDTVKGGGDTFEWTYPAVAGDPYSGRVFTVRFTGGDIEFELSAPGRYSGELTIQEA